MIFSPGNNKENDVSFAKVFDSSPSSDVVGTNNNNNSASLLGGVGLIVDHSAYSDAGSMDTECHQNPSDQDSIDLIIIKSHHQQFRLIPREVVHYMMESFIDDETLLKCILPLSKEYEDYSLDLIYRRNIGRGDKMMSFIFNYKTIAQIQSAETSEEESLLFSSEMFDKLFQHNVLKVIDLHDFCKHNTLIVVPLILQYSRQCEEFIKMCKKAKKKIVSPTTLVEGTVFPTSPVSENPDVFLLGEQHFNFKRLKQGTLSPRSALPLLQDDSLEKKQALLHKRYYQLVSLLNLILSVDYLKTWQWCIMNDMSMFRRISSKNGDKIAKIPKTVKRKEEEAFLFYRELFFSTREIKKIKSLANFKKTLELLILQMIEGEKPVRNHEEKKAFLLLVSVYDKINEDQQTTNKKVLKKILEFCSKHLIQTDDGLSRFELFETTTFNTKFFIEKCCPVLKKEMDKK